MPTCRKNLRAKIREEPYNGLRLNKKQPFVTSTLVVDNTAYISSSLKGGPFLYLLNGETDPNKSRYTDLNPKLEITEVQRALTRCQLAKFTEEGVNPGHRTGANCGEQMAALAFVTTQSQRSLKGAKIISIQGKKDNASVAPPCGDPKGNLIFTGEWGCHDFTSEIGMGMTVIKSKDRKARDVSPQDIAITYAVYP
ncbi:uncharacterized protein RCC_10913 [Ramularia collo-cygni]|uniref:Uncharacterized protein n=1 Tax=Ramularia collo-cygni TaxID=112498 RepID=A0A2D3VPU5_9PEZI|nr:uncharacterized protein RCC_10913 [Ramularia collo-cygni]CZT25184.1 uncharacterized protein RCC_10913 [Ramularia collo-cygni]